MHNVLVVIESVLLNCRAIFFFGLLTQSGFSVYMLIFFHNVIIRTIHNNSSKQVIEISSKRFRALPDHFLILSQYSSPKQGIIESCSFWEFSVNAVVQNDKLNILAVSSFSHEHIPRVGIGMHKSFFIDHIDKSF